MLQWKGLSMLFQSAPVCETQDIKSFNLTKTRTMTTREDRSKAVGFLFCAVYTLNKTGIAGTRL